MVEERTVDMVLKRPSRIAHTCLLLTIVCVGVMQAQKSAYDPVTQGAPAKPKQGFIDFTLKRNVVSLSLLGYLFVIVVYQHRQRVRREWSIAEMLQQYEHALSRADGQIDAATRRNHELFEALTAARENTFCSPILSTERREPAAPRATSKRTAETHPGKATAGTTTGFSTGATAPNGRVNGSKVANQMGLFKPEVDLILKVNSLEQQLGRSQEQEKQLRRQLTQADLRLQAEQQKNRALKGA